MLKNIKIAILLILSIATAKADNLMAKIEMEASRIDDCNLSQPCLISIEERNSEFIAKVRKAALITRYGVMKFKSGSTSYHIFDKKGLWVRKIHTL